MAAVLVRGMSLRPEDRQHRAGELAAELRATLERAPKARAGPGASRPRPSRRQTVGRRPTRHLHRPGR
ncbi:MAG: hypothetical protein WKF40_01560 [Thermoleophilaceae bacterium]